MILIIDCTVGVEFAIISNKKILFKKKNNKLKNISERLVLEVEKALTKLHSDYQNIKKVVIIIGPGSFTGVRTAVTFAKLLKLSLDIKIYGLSKFQIINFLTVSKSMSDTKNIFILNNNSSFFFQKFEKNGEIQSKPEIVDLRKRVIKITKESRIISDSFSIKKCFRQKKVTDIEIFRYNIQDVERLIQNLDEKKYIPKPLYIKSFF